MILLLISRMFNNIKLIFVSHKNSSFKLTACELDRNCVLFHSTSFDTKVNLSFHSVSHNIVAIAVFCI